MKLKEKNAEKIYIVIETRYYHTNTNLLAFNVDIM